MSLLWTLANVIEFILLLTLSGILVAVVASSKLLEFTITFTNPIFLLIVRQTGNIMIYMVGITIVHIKTLLHSNALPQGSPPPPES